MKNTINIATGEIIINNIRISPDITVPDCEELCLERKLKRLTKPDVTDYDRFMLLESAESNGISAYIIITFYKRSSSGRAVVSVQPVYASTDFVIRKCRGWISGLIPKELFISFTDTYLYADFSWGEISAFYTHDPYYGLTGGNINIFYKERNT